MRVLVPAASLLLASCALAHLRGDDGAVIADASVSDTSALVGTARHRLWVLVHPSDAPRGAGLYLYDRASGATSTYLPLPPGVTSPQGLAWDGHSIWLTDTGLTPSIVELDPSSGAVRSTISGFGSEGLAADGATLWVAGSFASAYAGAVVHMDERGAQLSVLRIPDASVQDLAFARGALYYLVNDAVDRIVRLDPSTGATSDLARGVDIAPYALGFDGEAIVVVASGQLSRFDPDSGALLGAEPLGVPGWVTAIVYVE